MGLLWKINVIMCGKSLTHSKYSINSGSPLSWARTMSVLLVSVSLLPQGFANEDVASGENCSQEG